MAAVSIEPSDSFLRVRFADGTHADFHYFWLRHNCDCCRHPQTGERIICSSNVPMAIRPESVALNTDATAVTVRWNDPDGHRSTFALPWLRMHAYALNRDNVLPPPGDLNAIEVDFAALGAAALDRCDDGVRRFGAIVVRGRGSDTEAIIDDFAQRGLQVIGTHFGRIEDLRTDNTTNDNTDQLGYTDAPVDLHTDQPFLDQPPRYQMLHCMQPAESGGENVVVDAWQAARHLRSVDAHAFELLTHIGVRFHRQQKKFERLVISPVIEIEGETIVRIRSSYFTMAPHRVPFEQMEQWYRAYNRFAEIVNDPRHQYRFLLRAGDFLLYDNHRMLHARTGFTGARWLRGVYFNQG
jgi:gamma-butyrobetaine dioxygenase/trimethyllysine dioxygenase